jgi:integrase
MPRARRGRGKGGVFQRESDGLWVGTVSLGYDQHGNRRRKTVYGKTKAEAVKNLEDARSRARVGAVSDIGAMTVGQLLDRWLDNLKARVGDRTHEEKESLTRVHLKPRIGGVRLAKLNGVHVRGVGDRVA